MSGLFLLFNTYRDLRDHTTDARLNAIIYGGLLMLIFVTYHNFILLVLWFILSVFVLAVLKKTGYAQGDITALRWLLIAWGVISPIHIIIFLMFFLFFVVVTRISWRWVNLSGGAPCYPAIFGAYIVTIILFLGL